MIFSVDTEKIFDNLTYLYDKSSEMLEIKGNLTWKSISTEPPKLTLYLMKKNCVLSL